MAALRCVRADNPSAMTGSGTNTYLLGRGAVVVIDPGPALPAHLAAILAALEPGERIAAILVTHSHLDHTALARPLAMATGAEVLAYGPAGSGRSPVMARLAAEGLQGGGEGFDPAFAPDRRLGHGEILRFGDLEIETLHTPGHTGCHLCFAHDGTLFSGDHVMGWATSLISPPDGDMAAYMASLALLAQRDWRVMLPGHGAPVTDPAARLADLTRHRHDRSAQILAALAESPATPAALTARIYTTTPAALLPAAMRNVLAHLIDLMGKGAVAADPGPGPGAIFRLA